MTQPADDAIRKVIEEESVRPRREKHATYLAAAVPQPLAVARADLLYLWDDYRAEHLDFAALANPIGHQHPMVTAAVTDHARYYGLTGPQGHHLLRWPVEYAKDLSERFSGHAEAPRKVLFTEGEREALYQATRLALRATGKPRVAVLDTGWHRWLPAADTDLLLEPGRLNPEVHGALVLAAVTTDAHPVLTLRDWMIAAREHGIPVIVDETVAGFGRLGVMWSQERTGLTADLTVLGGPCGGGWPLGAVIAAADYFTGGVDVSGQSGHPVACCAGSRTLDVLSLGVLEYMEDSSTLLTKGLTEVCAQFGHYLSGHHGEGLLRGLVFHDAAQALRFTLDCRAQGLYVAPPVGNTVVLAPVLITSTNEMTRGVDLIAATLLAWDDEPPGVI